MPRPFHLAKVVTRTVATGSTSAILAEAVPGFLTFDQAGVADGAQVSYSIVDGINCEVGQGQYNATTKALARVMVWKSTIGPLFNAYIPLSGFAHVSAVALPTDFDFLAGTIAIFQQTAAPVGWTKSTAYNDRTLRLVSGAVGAGGALGFSSAFSATSDGGHTPSMYYFPSHNHASSVFYGDASAASVGGLYGGTAGAIAYGLAAQGGSGYHYHTADIRVQHVDAILAIKD